jgi:hypothetical protein
VGPERTSTSPGNFQFILQILIPIFKAEIRARDDEAAQIQKIAHDMIERHHYASKDIERRTHECEAAYAKTKREWGLRNEWLQQVVQVSIFHSHYSNSLYLVAWISA